MAIKSINLSWIDFKELADNGTVCVIAIGAHEEHGPHCSLLTDTIISSALAERIAEKINGILLPALPFGESLTLSDFPGTITLRPEILAEVLRDISNSLIKSNVQGLIVINGHYGNMKPLESIKQSLMESESFPILIINFPGLDQIVSEICESRPAGNNFYHADEFETSLVLAIHPEGVRMEKAVPVYPDIPSGEDGEGVFISSFNPIGSFGDPTKADAEKGERLLSELVDKSMELVNPFIEMIETRKNTQNNRQ